MAVFEAMKLAANGEEFEVVYCPRASTQEFVVRQSSIKDALRVKWCMGMRFKMAFETEDSSRISWFVGTVSYVGAEDQIRWPNSPWRLLQVTWDELDLLRNVKRVSPWLVELVSSMPEDFYSPVFFPAKRPRYHIETLISSISSGVQGARQVRSRQLDFKLLEEEANVVGKTQPLFVLFGQPILTADQMSQSNCSVDIESNSF